MSAQNAIQLATAIQSKVGSSLISANNLLPDGDRAATMVQAGAGSLGVFLLRDLYKMQERTYECVEKVASILQSQLDLAEDAERRARDQAAELAKEKKPASGVAAGTGTGNDVSGDLKGALDDIEKDIEKGRFEELLTGGLTAALLAPQALKTLGKSLAGKLLKGGLYGGIATLIADPIINFIDEEMELNLTQDHKDTIKLSLIGSATAGAMFGLPGAIIGATLPMIASVGEYIAGFKDADEVTNYDWGGTALAAGTAGYFASGKVGALLAGSKFAGAKTLGLALGATPFMIGVGVAAALGVGLVYLSAKIDEYRDKILDNLAETVKDLDKDLGEWAAKEEEGLFERMGINLGNLSALGEAKVAAEQARKELDKDKEKFVNDTQMQYKFSGLIDAMTNYSDEAIKNILRDSTKANNFLDTVESIKSIAAQGGFGDNSQEVFETMAAFSDKVQGIAVKMLNDGEKGGKISSVALNKAGIGGDQLENLEGKSEELAAKKEELRLKKIELENAEKKLADLNEQGIKSTFFGENEAELTEDLIKQLKSEISGRNNPRNLENQIRIIEESMNKFGTTNGLLYNLDQLRELYKDDPGRLQAIIERSINQSGSTFLDVQKNMKPIESSQMGSPAPIMFNNNSQTQNLASQSNYIAKLNVHGDPFFSREAYVYGAI